MLPPKNTLLLLFATGALLALAGCTTPNHVYLTWQGDPSTTMTVNFHSPKAVEGIRLVYDTEQRAGDVGAYRFSVAGTARDFPDLGHERHLYAMEARDLTPGALYYFVLAEGDESVTDEMRFRPLPPKDAPLRFISGGDMSILPRAHQLTKLAGSMNPMFGLIGGDIAYANGELDNAWIWDRWLQMWENNMVAADGALVPMVLAAGNHEVNDEDGTPEQKAPFYFGYFPQGGSPYFTRRLRNDTVLFVLDSGHTVPHGGTQAEWLDATLEDHQDVRNTIAVYHAPLYPSHRDFEDWRAVDGRDNWLAIFDKWALRVALENHDHTFKRTKVLKGNQVVEEGTVYLGDGSFGVNPRTVPEPDRWYLEKASGTPHFWLVEIDDAGMHFQAISHAGDVLDSVDFE